MFDKILKSIYCYVKDDRNKVLMDIAKRYNLSEQELVSIYGFESYEKYLSKIQVASQSFNRTEFINDEDWMELSEHTDPKTNDSYLIDANNNAYLPKKIGIKLVNGSVKLN